MDFLKILVLYFLPLLTSVNTFTIDNHKLVYSQCSNQTSPNPSHSALLPNLFNQLISKSSKSNFFETIVGDDHQNVAISGAFQCRNDLSGEECKTCVKKLPSLLNNLCGENIPARIQLSGCSAHYYQENLAKIEMDTNPDDQIVLHRACSKRRIRRSGFEEIKRAAFASLENCVVSGEGFCETKYDESIRVLSQCGGSLRHCDCGECVSNAVEIAGDDECRFSVSGEIYLDSCFISYDYYGSRFGTFMDEGNKSAKLVAIAIGGLVVLSMGVGLLYFISSMGKKDDW